MDASPDGGGTSQRFAAMRHGSFRAYFLGAMFSMMGDNVEHVITYWVLFEKFHSPVLAGFAVIAHWVPALLSVQFGALADRYDCRKVIQASQALFMTVSIAWGVLFLTDSLQMWHAVILLILHGMAGALWSPAEQLMLHDIVGEEDLPSAVRLNATARNLGILGGPAVGSALLLGLGTTYGIFANVAIYLPLTIWLLFVPFSGHVRDAALGIRRPRVGFWDAPRVLREVSGIPTLLSMVALGGLGSLFIGNAIQPQMPEFAQDLGTTSAGVAYGALLAANAAGAVLGGFLLESTGLVRSNVRVAILSTGVWAICMIGFALTSDYGLALFLLALGGAGQLASLAISQTIVQVLAPSDKRGRVIGVYNVAASGLKAGSGVSIGLVGGLIGIHWSLGLSAVALLVSVVGLLLITTRAPRAALPALAT